MNKSSGSARSPVASASFAPYEERIRAAARRIPGMPEQEIILVRLYAHVFKHLDQALSRALDPFGLNAASWQVLIMLKSMPDVVARPTQLCAAISESRANMTRLADDLVARGLIARSNSKEDRRVIELALTAAGESLVKKVHPVAWQALRDIYAPFARSERRSFEAMLKKLLASLEAFAR